MRNKYKQSVLEQSFYKIFKTVTSLSTENAKAHNVLKLNNDNFQMREDFVLLYLLE